MPDEEDFTDAVLLLEVGFYPRSIDDYFALPSHVLEYFLSMRLGKGHREHPFDWWRIAPTLTAKLTHLYAATPSGQPEGPARCGYDPTTDPKVLQPPAFVRSDGVPHCRRCESGDEKPAAWGTIGGVQFGEPAAREP